ncbi:DUF6525 family protein [Neorhizobium alkalisoli]|uniref:Uncharacterized protein n=1 Tax=Neorhizobium alkalisoli TaxID=528178 RepID=A0A561QS88_9HYPH|nr:DUF6525 family protein [Neorhizobium alkalisoli]TWF53245.1 hypothetical protein FHW37_104522 [Neorhizobium alkalisoli]
MINILAPAPRIEIMHSFDALPDRIRRAIAQADFPFDPREIAERLAKGRRATAVLRSIQKRTSL